jgi:hypothetical protein
MLERPIRLLLALVALAVFTTPQQMGQRDQTLFFQQSPQQGAAEVIAHQALEMTVGLVAVVEETYLVTLVERLLLTKDMLVVMA